MATPNKRGLTVAQLIDVLRAMPPDAPVVYMDAEWGLIEVGGMRAMTAEEAAEEDYSYKYACAWLRDADAKD